MYKLVACDLDETLLSDDTHVSEENRYAIKQLHKKGIKFVLATGRGYRSVQQTLQEIGLANLADEYVISFNGACITENKNNRLIEFSGLELPIAEKLYRIGQKYDVCIHVYTKDVVYVYNMNQDEREYMTGRHEFVEITDKTLEFLDGASIAKVIFGNTDQAYLQTIEAELGTLAQQLDISYSSNRYLEFNQKGINKGYGLMKLAGLLAIDAKETMALGDNYNDLPMIKVAGLGVGMKNTNPGMRAECDFITENDNNHNGVAEALSKFILD